MFQVGDEVVCVNAEGCSELTRGATYVVTRVVLNGETYASDNATGTTWYNDCGEPTVWVRGGYPFWAQPEIGCGYDMARFRKVERRDLSAWLKTATDFEEPTRAPVVEPV